MKKVIQVNFMRKQNRNEWKCITLNRCKFVLSALFNSLRPAYYSEPSGSGGNPFGDESDHEEQASQDSTGMGDMVSAPVRVVYTYKAEEEDEISAEQGKGGP